MKKLVSLIIISQFLALAAYAKTQKASAKKSDDTLSVFSDAKLGAPSLKGLSVLAGFDFADSIEMSGSADLESEKSLVLGAQYEFSQFTPGLSAQVGGTYEFQKTVENTGGIKYQIWAVYGEMVAKLTPKFKLVGGLNYNFPDLSNAPGSKLSGGMGYQFGASFEATQALALDVRYRNIEMDLTYPADPANGVPTGGKRGVSSAGLFLNGRYMF